MSDHPREFDELTPEQHAALVELGRKMAEHMQQIADAFAAFAVMCAEAARNVETLHTAWDPVNDLAWDTTDDDDHDPGESP